MAKFAVFCGKIIAHDHCNRFIILLLRGILGSYSEEMAELIVYHLLCVFNRN